jgi:hypothetical protein
MFNDKREDRALERIAEASEDVVRELKEIAHLLRRLVGKQAEQVTDVTLSQIIQGDSMAITGTVVGTTSTFQIGLVPATNFVPLTSGPTVAVDDPLVTLTPVDASNDFTASVAATDTGASYNLTISWVNGAGVAGTHAFSIPILPTPPPPPVQVTDVSLNQLS